MWQGCTFVIWPTSCTICLHSSTFNHAQCWPHLQPTVSILHFAWCSHGICIWKFLCTQISVHTSLDCLITHVFLFFFLLFLFLSNFIYSLFLYFHWSNCTGISPLHCLLPTMDRWFYASMLPSGLLSWTSFSTCSVFVWLLCHVPYTHAYECVRHRPPIDYLCTCSCSWMGSHTWHWYLHFMCLNCIMVAVVYIYPLSIELPGGHSQMYVISRVLHVWILWWVWGWFARR